MFFVRSRTALVALLFLLIISCFLSISFLPSYGPVIRAQLPDFVNKYPFNLPKPASTELKTEAVPLLPEPPAVPGAIPAELLTPPPQLAPESHPSAPEAGAEIPKPLDPSQDPTHDDSLPEIFPGVEDPFGEEGDFEESDEEGDDKDFDEGFASAIEDVGVNTDASEETATDSMSRAISVVIPSKTQSAATSQSTETGVVANNAEPADEFTDELEQEDVPPPPDSLGGSSTESAPHITTSQPLHEVDWPERYVFAFGDSLTSTGFDIFGTKPSRNNPFGNPPFPGHSSSIGPNWIDDMIVSSPPNTLCYNFAAGAAVVDVDIVRPILSLIPFPYQVRNFTRYLATKTHPFFAPWQANNSVAIVFLGVNDVSAMQVYTDHATPQSLTDKIMDSYFDKIRNLYSRGLRRFVFMGVPPLYRFPFAIAPEPYEHHANLTTSCVYWNIVLAERTVALKQEYPDVIADVVLTDPFFHQAINDYTRYGALNQTCEAPDGRSCLWVDGLHPGVQIARLMGKGLYEHLLTSGFFGDGERANHTEWGHNPAKVPRVFRG